ncbi:signal transduction histidine kinase [Thermomonospora umbrina]|uniref:histidine kinase n=1 Tax=Thermomonospora umbrina TaxID=111806 RepID=A0A3D9T893_9ACTN|nr:signal transduction histidine kinase [Thermomonospora umbrina]
MTGRAAVRGAALWAVPAAPVVAGLPHGDTPAVCAQAAGLVALAAGLAAARRWPLAALLAVFSLPALSGNFAFALPVAGYLVGRRSPATRPVVWAYALICAGGAALNVARGTPVTTWFPLTVWLVLLGVLPWLAGRAWRQYTELLHAGWQRAEQLEREQRITAERERLRERSRIAHDMHDSLGHELALIALRAGALELAADLDGRHRAAAADLRASAATATARLQEIIGVLREESEPAPLEPAGHDVAALVDRAAASGMTVRLHHDPGPDPVVEGKGGTEMADHAVYRVVQEALTNAAKHAPGAEVTVRVRRGHRRTCVSVAHPRPPAGPPPATADGGGHGLTGLRERVRLSGGALRAGPTPDGGFEVAADLPHAPRPPGTPAAPSGHDRPTPAAPPDEGGDLRPGRETDPPPGPESESAQQWARRRRRFRRELLTAFAAPATLLAALSAVMVGHHLYITVNSVLPPDDYRRIAVGQHRAQIAPLLPDRRWPHDDPGANTDVPAGAACEHYRPDANVLGVGDVYRLCFAGERLVAKDVVRADAPR